MPTATTSQIIGFNVCFEPFPSMIYVRSTLSGYFTVVNKYLYEELVSHGISITKELIDQIESNNGSIKGIQAIPNDIQAIFERACELSGKKMIDMQAESQWFTDQSQSFNLFMKDPTRERLTLCHFHGWSRNLKTGMYYLRAPSISHGTKVTVKQTTPSVSTTPPQKNPADRSEQTPEITSKLKQILNMTTFQGSCSGGMCSS